MTGALLLIAATAGILALAGATASAMRLERSIDWLLAVATLAAAEILVLSIAAGLAHRYDRWSLTALAVTLGAGASAAALALPRDRRAHPPVVRRAREVVASLAWWQKGLVAAAIGALLWRVFLAVLLPPFAFDALTYHLTIVAGWLENDRIGVNPYSVCCARYPSTGEVMHAWPAVLLERDTLVDVSQIVFAMVGAVAVAGLARLAGAGARAAMTAGALFAMTPIVLVQSNTSYVDVTLATFFLVALYFAARYLESAPFSFGGSATAPRTPLIALSGIAAGITLGTKTHGILLVAVLTLVVAIRIVTARARRRLDGRSALVAGGAFAVAVVAVGGWWYGRNWIDVGNPIWPIEVSFLGVEVFGGNRDLEDLLTVPPGGNDLWIVEVARSWSADLTFWDRGSYSLEERSGGLGPLWSWAGWWGAIALAVHAVRRRPGFALDVLVPIALVFALQPYRWWSRFTIQLAAVGCIGLVVLVERSGARLGRTLVVATCLLAGSGAVISTVVLDPASRAPELGALRTLRLVGEPRSERTVGQLFFREYAWLDEIPADATVGVEVFAPSIRFVYPLFGPGLDRNVVLFFPGGENHVERRLAGVRQEPSYVAVEADGEYDAALRVTGGSAVFDRDGVRVYRLEATSEGAG